MNDLFQDLKNDFYNNKLRFVTKIGIICFILVLCEGVADILAATQLADEILQLVLSGLVFTFVVGLYEKLSKPKKSNYD